MIKFPLIDRIIKWFEEVGVKNKAYDSDLDGVLDVTAIPYLSRSKITDFFASPFWDNIPDKPSTFPPSAHARSHADGGSDPISPSDIGAIPSSEKGAVNGVCELDADALVPLKRIPTIPDTKLAFSTWKLVSVADISAAVSGVTFSSLDINVDGAYLLFGTIKNPTTSSWLWLYPGEDTTATNYRSLYFAAFFDGTVTTTSTANVAYPTTVWVPESGYCSFLAIVMRDPAGYYRAMCLSNYTANNYPTILLTWVCGTSTITNITSLKLEDDGGESTIGAGSLIYLCKIKT